MAMFSRKVAAEVVPFVLGGGLVGLGFFSYNLGVDSAYKYGRDSLSKLVPFVDSKNPSHRFDSANTLINAVSIGKRKHAPGPFNTGDTTFAFGVDGGHYLGYRHREGQNKTNWVLPYSSYYNKCGYHVGTVYSTAISPTGDEFIAYWDKLLGRANWVFSKNVSAKDTPSYTSLTTWLSKNIDADEDKLKTVTVVFGPGSSCFAKTENACYWQDLPMKLETVLEEKKTAYATDNEHKNNPNGWIPRILALGGNDTYIAIWEDGRFITSLNSACPGYASLSDADGADGWENIVLSPHNQVDYFATLKIGVALVALKNSSSSDPQPISDAIMEYLRFRAKADKSHFQVVNSKTSKVVMEIRGDEEYTSSSPNPRPKL